jgi:cytochrome c6
MSRIWQIRCSVTAQERYKHMNTSLGSALESAGFSSNLVMMDRLKSENLLATVLGIAIFMGSTVSAGFGQAAGSPAADTYKTNCVACHAADGHGSAVGKSLHAADFNSPQVQQQSDTQLADIITQGKGNMPAFGHSLSKNQIDALVKYIRTFKKAK